MAVLLPLLLDDDLLVELEAAKLAKVSRQQYTASRAQTIRIRLLFMLPIGWWLLLLLSLILMLLLLLLLFLLFCAPFETSGEKIEISTAY